MTLNKVGYALLIMIAGCLGNRAEGGQRVTPGCDNGLGIGCAPRRITYGYYPTTWRRWPAEMSAMAPQPAPERVPTPAVQEPTPDVRPEEQIAPEREAPLLPTEPGMPQFQEETLTPPFEDTPPRPPSRSNPGAPVDAMDNPPSRTPASEVPMPLPSADDAPPSMPEDDPFRDDPEPPPVESAEEPSESTSLKDNPSRPRSVQWQTAGRPATIKADGDPVKQILPERAPLLKEPRLLAPVESRAIETADLPDTKDTAPAETSSKKNPLRSTLKSVRAAHLVPAAKPVVSGRVEEPSANMPVSTAKRNPLRGN